MLWWAWPVVFMIYNIYPRVFSDVVVGVACGVYDIQYLSTCIFRCFGGRGLWCLYHHTHHITISGVFVDKEKVG